MKIVAISDPQYKYSFIFEYSEKMEWYCRLLNKNSLVIFYDNDEWKFNDLAVIDEIKKSFPEVEIDEHVEMDRVLGEVVTCPFVLRDYQKAAVEEGVKFMMSKEKRGGLLVLPTGSGKSLVIASIAQNLPGKTIVLQPTKEILEQNHKKAVSFGFKNIGIFSASMGRKDIGKLTFATIGTIITKKEFFLDFTNLIIDESHLVNSKGGMYQEFIKFFGGKCLGLTATPYRLHSYNDIKTGDRKVVAKFLTRTSPRIFSTILHVTQVEELYEKGFLCPVVYEFNSDYDQSQIKLNSTGMDFDERSLLQYNEKMGTIGIVSNTIKQRGSKHVLVFVSSVDEAELLGQNLREAGISATAISAKTPKKDREIILKDFRNGKIQAVTNVGVLTTGFDFPELDCIILARPTQSVALYYQICGRGIRVADGKPYVKIIDVCGNVGKFGRIETFTVVPTSTGVRLKSNVGFLTGVNFAAASEKEESILGLSTVAKPDLRAGREDLEIKNYEGVEEATGYDSDIINFGKHKGTHITKLPTAYLTWISENFGEGELKRKFQRELLRRTN